MVNVTKVGTKIRLHEFEKTVPRNQMLTGIVPKPPMGGGVWVGQNLEHALQPYITDA